MTLALHLIGFGGVLLAMGLSTAPLKAVLEARDSGSLGGLDTRNWALFFFLNLMWTYYALEIRDFWLFLSAAIPLSTWLWFCITGVELLSQEEGELHPALPRAESPEGETLPPDWLRDFEEVHNASAIYRQQALRGLRGKVAIALFVGTMLAFILSPRTMSGLEFYDDFFPPDLRLTLFSIAAAGSSMVCWIFPVLRMGSIIKRKDASTVFIPATIAQIVMTFAWGAYGVLIADWAVLIPNFTGSVCAAMFVVLRLIYGNGANGVSDSTEVVEIGVNDDCASEAPSATSARTSIPRMPASRQSSKRSTTSESLKIVGNVSPSLCKNMKRTESNISSTCLSDTESSLGGCDITVTGSPLASPRPASLAGSGSGSTSFGGIVCTGSGDASGSIKVQSDLPDLSQRLKDCGVYEDYLKWQQGYRRWRSGSAQGAQGEVANVGTQKQTSHSHSNASTQKHGPHASVLPCMPEGDDMMEEEV